MDYKIKIVPTFSIRSVNHHDRASFKKANLPTDIFKGGASTSHALYQSLGLPFWMESTPDSQTAILMLFHNARLS